MNRAAAERGIAAVGLNFRSCSGEINRTPRLYHSGETGDLAFVLDLLRARYPGRPLGAVGFFAWRENVPEHWMFYGFLALLAVSYALSWRWPSIIRFARRRRRRLQSGIAARAPAR